MPAPAASGWSGRRVGLAPTGKAPPSHGALGERSFAGALVTASRRDQLFDPPWGAGSRQHWRPFMCAYGLCSKIVMDYRRKNTEMQQHGHGGSEVR